MVGAKGTLPMSLHCRLINHCSDDCVVELHWSLTPRYLPFVRHPEWLWDMQLTVNTAGRPMQTMAPEWLLLFLCVHGAKHCWERLNWVSDVARLIDGHVTLDWEGLLAESEESGSRRMLFVGILLARDLVGTPLPAQIASRVEADVVATRLAHELGQNVLTDAYRKKGAGARLSLHFRMRERLRDRLRYARHVALTPSVRDFESIRLPKYLSIMYLPMRPLRLVRVRELLAREGVEVAYTTLRRYAHDELGWREKPTTVRVDDPPPGEEAQVDFGKMGLIVDEETGKRRVLWVLVVLFLVYKLRPAGA